MKRSFIIFFLSILSFSFTYADGYQVGDKATDFSLKNVDGTLVSMNDFEDAKGIIVIFTCNHCPYSVLYEDRIIELDKKYKDKGYPVVAINPNDPVKQPEDSYENMIIRAEEKGFTFPYLWDNGQQVTEAYGASRTPHVFLLEKVDSEYFVRYIGAIDDNSKSPEDVEEKFVENAIDALLSGEKPDPDFTKAIGCTIKWAD
jgi:peroxiredoxin